MNCPYEQCQTTKKIKKQKNPKITVSFKKGDDLNDSQIHTLFEMLREKRSLPIKKNLTKNANLIHIKLFPKINVSIIFNF